MRWVAWLVAGLVAVLCVGPASRVSAQSESFSAEARQRFDLAAEAFERGDFATALTDFERVYGLLDGHPRRSLLLYNMARSNEELGRNREALHLYERFLAESGEDAPNRPEAQQHVSELRLRVGLAETAPSSGAMATTSSTSPIGPIVLGLGAATLIAAAITGGVVVAEDAALTAMCSDGACPGAARSHANGIEALANATDALWIGGAVVGVTGLILTLVLRDESPAPPVAASCSEKGCSLQVRGTF
jgi:tetratricopeptide (TPR) repeat protein